LGCTTVFGLVFLWALAGCSGGGGGGGIVISGGVVGLTAENVAALGGLTFDFPDATIFGFSGESTTLMLGADGTTFTLTTSGGTVINGTITNGPTPFVSCRLTQNPEEVGEGEEQFNEEYDTCEATVASTGEIEFGSSGAGTVTLSIGSSGETAVESNPEDVTLNLHDDGTVTINDNVRPI
jgi:hypothetical protein